MGFCALVLYISAALVRPILLPPAQCLQPISLFPSISYAWICFIHEPFISETKSLMSIFGMVFTASFKVMTCFALEHPVQYRIQSLFRFAQYTYKTVQSEIMYSWIFFLLFEIASGYKHTRSYGRQLPTSYKLATHKQMNDLPPQPRETTVGRLRREDAFFVAYSKQFIRDLYTAKRTPESYTAWKEPATKTFSDHPIHHVSRLYDLGHWVEEDYYCKDEAGGAVQKESLYMGGLHTWKST